MTFTMEDALISPAGFMILSGAGLVEATEDNTIKVHTTETVDNAVFNGNTLTLTVSETRIYDRTSDGAAKEDYIYVMFMKDGAIVSEPYIGTAGQDGAITVQAINTDNRLEAYEPKWDSASTGLGEELQSGVNYVVFVDYYVEKASKVQQINITPDKFGGNYYLEASTLFRTEDGIDLPAEFIIPNCKIQSNFNFTMASSGDPSTFTFTMDAFPDYTRFDKKNKVLAAIQVINEEDDVTTQIRSATVHTEGDHPEFE